MSIRPLIATLTAALALHAAASAQSLKLGDKAPPLKVATFLQGEPVTEFQKGKPYVVEFWATWCGPCVQSIPHINELSKKYKDQGLTVIGVDILENDPPKVEAFLQKMKADMSYTVARDLLAADDERGETGFMLKSWMEAAGQQGIPTAFIVDRAGQIAWIGHPMEMDEPLAAVLAGTWNLEQARAAAARAKELEAKQAEIFERLNAAASKQDFAGALAIVDELIALDPSYAKEFAWLRADVMLRGKDLDAAYAYAREVAKGVLADDAQSLGRIAWLIVDPKRKDLARRDLDVAQALAERADSLAEGKEPAYKDTLARIQFHRGDLAKAIELQTKAVELARDPRMKAQLSGTLEEYKTAQGGGAGR